MRHRAWGLLVLVPAAMFVTVLVFSPFRSFHIDLYLSGTPARFAAVVVRAGRSNARGALWLDNIFVLSWLTLVPPLLRAGLQRWAPERRRVFGTWSYMPAIAVAAAVVDLVENALSLFLVGKARPPSAVTLAITTAAWSSWLLYALAVVGLGGLVIGPLLAPIVRPGMLRFGSLLDRRAGGHPTPSSATPPVDRVDPGDPVDLARRADVDGPSSFGEAGASAPSIGVCLSGGGIRAGSVAIGTLRRLDAARADGPSLFQRSRWLVAVSGGAYAAGGWRASRRRGGTVGLPGSIERDGLFDSGQPWAATVCERRRFLDNGGLSIVGGILNVFVRSIVVLGAIVSAAYIVGLSAGAAVPTRALHREFPFVDASGDQRLVLRDLIPARLMVPGVTLVVLAGLLALIAFSSARGHRRTTLLSLASALVAGGALLFAVLVGVPIGVVYGRRALASLPRLSADGGAGLLGALSAIGLGGALAGVLVAQLKQRWMRLGGVLLAVALALFAGKVADTFAWGYQGVWRSWPLPFTDRRCPVLVIGIVWLLVTDSIASHRLTLGGVYRKRLAATFVLGDGTSPPLPPLPYAQEPLWAAYQHLPGPELIVAATAHSSIDTFCGLPAYAFTFRPSRITMHDRVDELSASVATAQYPAGSWWEGYPRGWLITRSMALSGAAFASAMGRQALGTTNALLVALNLRLGAWVPNPRFPNWFADRAMAPRVHLGYLAKELFGRYRPDRDAFVYIADGGHRENLGLVELLRERPDVVFCLDASGDRPDSFQTLHEAIELAIVELGVDVDIDLSRLRRSGTMPIDSVATGTIRYSDGTTAVLVYGKSQLSEAAGQGLLQYGALDDRFPDYSTIDQYLTEIEHLQLVALGHHIGERMVATFDGLPPATP
ncbi:MAG: hypothetical protein FD127_3082 [Acidimicrobiaceae bacterium]|nr:MAG: hypothetical protein FD127_3082 [Acidimicrobiaceae bacterium]